MTPGDVKEIDVRGQRLAYFEQGEGPLVICVHGYPDTAESFSPMVDALAQAGFRAVAPFLRGYHPSAAASDGDYSGITVGQDILALIEALSESTAAVVGHDWGALAAFSATMQGRPGIIAALVTLAIPHPRALKPSLKSLWRARHFLTYQLRSRATRHLKANDYEHIDQIYRRWSPTWANNAAAIERAKTCFRRPGVAEAALGFYWSWRSEQRHKKHRRTLSQRIRVPSLALGGRQDGALDPSLYQHTPEHYTAHYEWELLDGVGHFPHSEAPERVIPRVVAFLDAHGRGE